MNMLLGIVAFACFYGAAVVTVYAIRDLLDRSSLRKNGGIWQWRVGMYGGSFYRRSGKVRTLQAYRNESGIWVVR